MKLFNDTITNAPPQAPPVEAPALVKDTIRHESGGADGLGAGHQPGHVNRGPAEHLSYEVAYIADKPTPIVWAIPLSWKLSNLPKPEIRMNQGVKDWCSYSTAFSNWLFTCLSVFVCLSVDELTVQVPDQFIDDLDVKELTIQRTYGKGGIQIVTVYA